jgi:predicted HTH transcriptional regulator
MYNENEFNLLIAQFRKTIPTANIDAIAQSALDNATCDFRLEGEAFYIRAIDNMIALLDAHLSA